MTIQLLDQISDLPCGDSFLIESDDGCFQIISSPGVVRDQLLIEDSITVARNRDVELSILCIQIPFVVAVAAVSGVVAFCTMFLVSEKSSQLVLQEIVNGVSRIREKQSARSSGDR